MGPPYVANPEVCKKMSPTGNYGLPLVLPVRFQTPHGHMHLGGNQNGALGAGTPGLAAILVPKGTTGTRALVKKRKIGLGTQTRGGLRAMRCGAFGPRRPELRSHED